MEVCVYSFDGYYILLSSEILLTYTIKNVIVKKLCILLQVNHYGDAAFKLKLYIHDGPSLGNLPL